MTSWPNGAPRPGDRAALSRKVTKLRTTVSRQDGTVVLDGTAVCYTAALPGTS
jgi:hypothetical protein